MAYYHPKSGSEVEISKDYVKVLTGTAHEVRQLLDKTSERPIMPESVKTLYDLLEQIILNPKIPVHQILEYRQDKTTRDLAPQTFEGMWTIAFALGAVRGYESVVLQSGKVETGLTPIPKQSVLDALKQASILTSSKSGASDISFSIGASDTGKCESASVDCAPRPDAPAPPARNFVFCTAKYFKRDESKSVDSYDIANIMAAAKSAGYSEDEYRILVLVNNKDAAKTVFENARRRYMTKPVKRGEILGRSDLEAAFTQLRERVASVGKPIEFIQTTFLGTKPPRPFLTLRFHQELIVQKTMDIAKKGERSTVLWGVVARGGKTYICGGLIRAMQPKNVFIVAGAYTETHTQFLDYLLDTSKCGFQDFADYTIVNVKSDKFKYEEGKKYIFFLSAELLKGTGKTAKEREAMALVTNKKIVPDLVFFDEIHKGGTTQLADEAMALISTSAFKVFMTATYVKPFIKPEYNIDASNLITWGYEDIQMAKTLTSEDTLKYFETKYGKELCDRVLDLQRGRGTSMEEIEAQYMKFPEIQFLTTMFSPSFEESMTRQNILDPKAGFSLRALLAVSPDCMKVPFAQRYKCLKNGLSAGVFLNYIAPATTQMDTLDAAAVMSPNEHIVDRIGRNSQMIGDRLSNINTQFRPHSHLWFLPQPIGDGSESPLIAMMTAFASLLQQHPWFAKHFCVAVVASTFKPTEEELPFGTDGFIAFTNGGTDTKDTILDLESRAYAKTRGLLILAGKMLTLGISLPCVDVVALIDDSESSDLTYQKMFRALTESDGKKVGYVIDVNPVRTLKTLYDYTMIEKSETNPSGADDVDAVTLTNLYLIDQDQLFTIGTDKSRITSDAIHTKINELLQSGRKIYRSIVDEAASKLMALNLSEEVDILKDALNPSKPQALQLALDLAGQDVASVPSGIERIETGESAKKDKKEDNKTKELLQSLREMILTSFVMLAFLTTATTFEEAIQKYQMNADGIKDAIYRVLVDRALVKETTDAATVHGVLGPALVKSQAQITHPYFKMHKKFSDPSNDHREVIEFLIQNLTPKREQVATRGEVFTPLDLVKDMMSHLPSELWSNPDLKWLDPANGIGNFPVIIFTLLDDGLKTAIPDPMKRRKHIVESMLYMVELDDTNVMLSKKLLQKMCGTSDCKMNIIQADFLTVDFESTKFDVIVGNPPYNKPKAGPGSTGNSFWQNFVVKSETLLNPGGFICMVHPPGWKKPAYKPYNPEKFTGNDYRSEVLQGHVWQYFKTLGSFRYVYTNDQRSKTAEYFPNFPAVDYYVFQKGGKGDCETRNIFCGLEYKSPAFALNPTLPYLPCLLTKETHAVVEKIVTTPGTKLTFKAGFDPRGFKSKDPGDVRYIYESSAKGPVYQSFAESHELVDTSKLVINYIGGIDGYYVKYIDAGDKIGVLHHSMYSPVASAAEGARMEKFFQSDLVKFLFLITQYASGQRTLNEHHVASSITIPPESVTDYYAFFGLESLKPFVEDTLAKYKAFKTPARKQASTTPRRKRSPNTTARNPAK